MNFLSNGGGYCATGDGDTVSPEVVLVIDSESLAQFVNWLSTVKMLGNKVFPLITIFFRQNGEPYIWDLLSVMHHSPVTLRSAL